MGDRRALEIYPGPSVTTDEQITENVRARSGTAYHPVGTLAMGVENTTVTNPMLKLNHYPPQENPTSVSNIGVVLHTNSGGG